MKKVNSLFLVIFFSFTPLAPQCTKTPGLSFDSCQLFNTHKNPDGSSQPIIAATKYNTPLGTQYASNRMKASISRTLTHKNHPAGSELFPSDANLAKLLDTFLQSVEVLDEADKKDYSARFKKGKDDYFIVYFQRLQLTLLHEIYQYLLTIYTTFNLSTIPSVSELMTNEMSAALNKKTLIINHLVNIIESQANKAITTRFPQIPQQIATAFGPTIMQHDNGADLNQMIEKDELTFYEEVGYDTSNGLDALNLDAGTKEFYTYYKARKDCYLKIFGNYLVLFKNFTETLKQRDVIYGTKFLTHAKKIQTILENHSPKASAGTLSVANKAAYLQSIKPINPPLFFYADETLRAIKIIPKVAQSLPNNSQKISWPQHLIEAAQQGKPITNKYGNVISRGSPAFFLDQNGNKTTSAQEAVKLFVNIPTIDNIYCQEIIHQPDWLNSEAGVIAMLRACLGDYTAFFDPILKSEQIIDPCLACIIMNAANAVGIMSIDKGICDQCAGYLNAMKNLLSEQAPTQPPPPPLNL